ncbi:MAG TPA: DUF1615 domain-containing protein [Rhodanobacteraceae bacterium]|nr:DUF1615 domain-containing protein [Rhodanobacteraceae bacterium]
MPRRALLLAALALLGACATQKRAREPLHRPAEVRARIVRLLPAVTADREGWATDIQAAFAALRIEPTEQNLCATLAVAGQESTYTADPAVPGLAKIARAEIDRRAKRHHVPELLVRGALMIESPNGKRYGDRIASVRTEKDLSRIYEDLIGTVPLGQLLFGDSNPVRTGGPMQVSVGFAEQYARDHPYPYPVDGSIRHEVFSRRGGIYFGIAHLLGYPASYDQPLYRFADFNAGWYASRNAAFQKAVRLASGIPLSLDGDLIRHGSGRDGSKVGATELAVRSLGSRLDLSDRQIRRALEQGESLDFEETSLYRRTFALAERIERRPLPRAIVPHIALKSPKISRKLTTEWFAVRVDRRYRSCMAKTPGHVRGN